MGWHEPQEGERVLAARYLDDAADSVVEEGTFLRTVTRECPGWLPATLPVVLFDDGTEAETLPTELWVKDGAGRWCHRPLADDGGKT